jgi:hypothetical protein
MSIFYSDLIAESSIDANNVISDALVINSTLDLSSASILGSLIPNADDTYDLGSNAKKNGGVSMPTLPSLDQHFMLMLLIATLQVQIL